MTIKNLRCAYQEAPHASDEWFRTRSALWTAIARRDERLRRIRHTLAAAQIPQHVRDMCRAYGLRAE
jgi:hypothetical protein